MVTLAMSTERAIRELLHGLLPERRLRSNARVVRRKMSCFNVKRAQHRASPRATRPLAESLRVLAAP
jgi:hypothetical protein